MMGVKRVAVGRWGGGASVRPCENSNQEEQEKWFRNPEICARVNFGCFLSGFG